MDRRMHRTPFCSALAVCLLLGACTPVAGARGSTSASPAAPRPAASGSEPRASERSLRLEERRLRRERREQNVRSGVIQHELRARNAPATVD
jgi:hypothetical protein